MYSEEFTKEYLNSLGNLVLISGSHNASIGNKAFKKKLKSYNENPLLNQQGEIKFFISGTDDKPKWDENAINKRHNVLHSFAVNTWNFDFA
jgi:hypothetical protein